MHRSASAFAALRWLQQVAQRTARVWFSLCRLDTDPLPQLQKCEASPLAAELCGREPSRADVQTALLSLLHTRSAGWTALPHSHEPPERAMAEK